MESAMKSKSPTLRRILREAQELANNPSADYHAMPLESDLFEWHFTIRGPPSSAYSAGLYHGRITLPAQYPLRPPNFRFMTPNGRFETNREICLSISGHHEETWQPAWGLRTALVALRTFMDTDPEGQVGGLSTTEDRRRVLATQSGAFKCPVCNRTNADIMAECETKAKECAENSANAPAGAPAGAPGSSDNSRGKLATEEVPKELTMRVKDTEEQKDKVRDAAATVTAAPVYPPVVSTAPSPENTNTTTAARAQAPEPRTRVREDSMDSEEAHLAEGFVQTVPIGTPHVTTQTQQYPRARPVQGVPRQTGAPYAQQPGRGALAQAGRANNARASWWIDNAIYTLVLLLLFMIVKVIAF